MGEGGGVLGGEREEERGEGESERERGGGVKRERLCVCEGVYDLIIEEFIVIVLN